MKTRIRYSKVEVFFHGCMDNVAGLSSADRVRVRNSLTIIASYHFLCSPSPKRLDLISTVVFL